ncbi:MAG: phytoene desaturase family protein [Crocinitomicaceae bacterium]|nr:phytoene desaturase family protein [Crocinitomicaceae bacterium]
MSKKKAIIIGAGIAGIASAIRTSKLGYEVVVFESNANAGGKLNEKKIGAYRFDMGPSLFTMPQYIEELFELSNKKTSDYFRYKKCENTCNYFFEDGTFLSLCSDKEKNHKTILNVLGVDPKFYKKRIKNSAFIYGKTHKIFLEKSLHKFKNYFTLDTLKSIIAIPKLSIFTSMNKENERNLNHPKLIQIFNRYATYNGSNPYKAPGILNIIPHLENEFGVFFPENGMYSISKSLEKLAIDLGVEFRYNSKVEEIIIEKNAAKGVFYNSKPYFSDIVINNADVNFTYKHLLKQEFKTNHKKREPSSSALIFYWGIKKSFPNLDLHNIFFSEDYKSEFETIFNTKEKIPEDPTIYINISSKHNKSDAPEGKENWFVMVNTQYNQGQNWESYRKKIREIILLKLSRMLKQDIGELIEEEDYLDPILIEKNTSSIGGSLYGSSSNTKFAAFLRHPNFSKIKNLYFVGGSVHPGGGIPLCLLSAKIVSNEFIST